MTVALARPQDAAAAMGYEKAEPDVVRKQQSLADSEDDSADSDHSAHRRSSMASERRSSIASDCSSQKRSSFKKEGRKASLKVAKEISVRLPGKSRSVKKQRSISFCSQVKVQPVKTVDELGELVEDLWFKNEDYEGMRKSSMEIVDRVKGGEEGCLSPSKEDARGLEKFIEPDEVFESKVWAWDTVLEEQQSQRELGFWDDEVLAEAYHSSTLHAAIDAAERAKRDKEEIDAYLESAREEFDQKS